MIPTTRRSHAALFAATTLLFAACDSGTDPTAPSLDDDALRTVLTDAIVDEYRARATYLRVTDDFGAILPFVNIAEAEARHAASIAGLFEARGWSVPADPFDPSDAEAFADPATACAVGVEAEIANVALYDRLLAQGLPWDVSRVFDNNRRASLDKHLPAFQSCSGA